MAICTASSPDAMLVLYADDSRIKTVNSVGNLSVRLWIIL
jgi:hypothetical protein